MAALTIRNIDDAIKAGLRVRAAQNGRSMEDEARRILAQALRETGSAPAEVGLGTRLHNQFAGLGDLPLPTRNLSRAAPDFADRKTKRK